MTWRLYSYLESNIKKKINACTALNTEFFKKLYLHQAVQILVTMQRYKNRKFVNHESDLWVQQRDRSADYLQSLISTLPLPHVSKLLFEPHHEKTNILVSDLVQHKPGCTATKDG